MGVWWSTDPKDQDFYVYGYCNGNPIILIDPNGEYWIGAIIGAVVGAYAGGAMANGSFNPGQWDWDNAGTWTGMIGGAVSGASLGSGIENSILRSHFGNLTNMPQTRYGLNAYVSARGGMLQIRNDIITKAYNLGGPEPMQNTLDFLARHEGMPGEFYYSESPNARIPTARGNTPNSEGSIIYKKAFELNGKFEPSSVVQTMSHESFMQSNFLELPPDQLGRDIYRRFMEIGAYEHDVLNASRYGFSVPVRNYAFNNLQGWLNAPLPF